MKKGILLLITILFISLTASFIFAPSPSTTVELEQVKNQIATSEVLSEKEKEYHTKYAEIEAKYGRLNYIVKHDENNLSPEEEQNMTMEINILNE